MQSISTKTGDNGQTSLANGSRVAKDSAIMELLGTIDELSSWLGLVIAQLGTSYGQKRQSLERIQQDLYHLSAVLAQAPTAKFIDSRLESLEVEAEELQARLKAGWHDDFLYPGGTELGAYLDLARTVCRRSERRLVAYQKQDQEQEHPGLALPYLNRLSDYLFLLRCYFNQVQEHPEKELKSSK